MLLSDQYSSTIKAISFQNDDKMVFKEKSEFSGSLIDQLNNSYNYINHYNETRSKIEGLNRIDTHSYSLIAIRESLLNAIVLLLDENALINWNMVQEFSKVSQTTALTFL